jgi:hypothetical protein
VKDNNLIAHHTTDRFQAPRRVLVQFQPENPSYDLNTGILTCVCCLKKHEHQLYFESRYQTSNLIKHKFLIVKTVVLPLQTRAQPVEE